MNDNTYEVLKFLFKNAGKACSGEELGIKLGMSRAGISKHIKTLKALDFNIISGTKTGHILYDDRDILNEYYIKLKLNSLGIDLPAIYKKSTGSTNLDGKECAGKLKNGLVVASAQTGGRGRKERVFLSEDGGLYFSYILSPANLKPYDALKTVLLCGIAVCRVCEKYKVQALLKWPNDVMVNDKKICGILAEMISSSDVLQHLILGIGINVNNQVKQVPTATALIELCGKTFKRAEVLADTVLEINTIFKTFYDTGFKYFLDEYKNLSNTLGKTVKVLENDKSYCATAIDIDSDGFLIVKTEEGKSRLITADVSIR